MKELTIEEKAKAYDEVFNVAMEIYQTQPMYRDWLEKMFPELAENEDERIREALINMVECAYKRGVIILGEKEKEKYIAWLEKQGNPTDKVEPKFHEGDWIVHHGTENIYQVVAVIDNQYQLKYGDTYTVQKCADVDRCARLWDINKDAKDGDVLYAGNAACIFRKTMEDDDAIWIDTYCGININNEFKVNNKDECWCLSSYCSPANKEQRDLLFQKMKESGYEWDAEKKELKKIEGESFVIDEGKAEMDYCLSKMMSGEKVSPAWSEEDEKAINDIMWIIEAYRENGFNKTHKQMANNAEKWLKFLKNRVQPKQEWSEEDEDVINHLLAICAGAKKYRQFAGCLQEDITKYQTWLKSLKVRCTWKPSEEQMKALHDLNLTGNISYAGQGQVLIELYNDLKKLKG